MAFELSISMRFLALKQLYGGKTLNTLEFLPEYTYIFGFIRFAHPKLGRLSIVLIIVQTLVVTRRPWFSTAPSSLNLNIFTMVLSPTRSSSGVASSTILNDAIPAFPLWSSDGVLPAGPFGSQKEAVDTVKKYAISQDFAVSILCSNSCGSAFLSAVTREIRGS